MGFSCLQCAFYDWPVFWSVVWRGGGVTSYIQYNGLYCDVIFLGCTGCQIFTSHPVFFRANNMQINSIFHKQNKTTCDFVPCFHLEKCFSVFAVNLWRVYGSCKSTSTQHNKSTDIRMQQCRQLCVQTKIWIHRWLCHELYLFHRLSGLQSSLDLALFLDPDDENSRLLLARIQVHLGIDLEEVHWVEYCILFIKNYSGVAPSVTSLVWPDFFGPLVARLTGMRGNLICWRIVGVFLR